MAFMKQPENNVSTSVDGTSSTASSLATLHERLDILTAGTESVELLIRRLLDKVDKLEKEIKRLRANFDGGR